MNAKSGRSIKIRFHIFLGLALAQVASAASPILIVTSSSHKVQLGRGDFKEIFLGVRTMVDGWRVAPLNQAHASPVRAQFQRLLLGKEPTEMKIYWAEKIFSGKARAPKEVLNDEAVIQEIINNPDAIGYVSGSADTSHVNVLLKLE